MVDDSLILYTFRRCPFAIRVRMVLAEKGIRYLAKEENLSHPSKELLGLNPEGSVPVLIHNGNTILESAIITEYLDEEFKQNPLMPATTFEKAQVRMLTKECDMVFKPDLDLYKYEFKNLSSVEQESLIHRLRNYFDKIQNVLSNQNFLLGSKLTLADIHLFPFYRQIQKSNPLFNTHFSVSPLNTWLDRIVCRPSFQIVMEKN